MSPKTESHTYYMYKYSYLIWCILHLLIWAIWVFRLCNCVHKFVNHDFAHRHDSFNGYAVSLKGYFLVGTQLPYCRSMILSSVDPCIAVATHNHFQSCMLYNYKN